jgi:hypothetical protein
MNAQPILLVENDENDIFFIRRAFEKARITIPLRVVCDGQEALDYFLGTVLFLIEKRIRCHV